jgi:tetratricopeptide (TPR) repeat protein
MPEHEVEKREIPWNATWGFDGVRRFQKFAFFTFVFLFFVESASAAEYIPHRPNRLTSIHFTLFKIYRQQQCQEKMIEEAQQISELIPNDPDLEFFLGNSMQLGNFKAALEHYKRAAELAPSNLEYAQALGYALGRTGDWQGYSEILKRLEEKRHPFLPFPNDTEKYSPWMKPTASLSTKRTSMILNQGRSMVDIGELPTSTSKISINIRNADFAVMFEDRKNIAFITNYPHHWTDRSGHMNQEAISPPRRGYFQSINGIEALYGNHIKGSSEGMSIDHSLFQLAPTKNGGPSELRFAEDGAYINGQRLRIGALDPDDHDEPDVAQLIVPIDYSGQLSLNTDRGWIKLEQWKGSLKLFSSRPRNFEIGKVKGSPNCNVQCDGYVNLNIRNLQAENLTIKTGTSSSVTATVSHVDNAKLTAMGQGRIVLNTEEGKKCDVTGSEGNYVVNVQKRNDAQSDLQGAPDKVEHPIYTIPVTTPQVRPPAIHGPRFSASSSSRVLGQSAFNKRDRLRSARSSPPV